MATQQDVAEHIDLSTRRVRGLIQTGIFPPSKGRGGMDLDVCRIAYIRYLREIPKGRIQETDEQTIELNRERARNLRADTRLKKLREARLRKEFAPVDLLEWCLNKTCIQISEALGKIPQRIEKRVPKLSNAELSIIQREVAKCQAVAVGARLDVDEFDRDDTLQDRSIRPS